MLCELSTAYCKLPNYLGFKVISNISVESFFFTNFNN